MAAAKQLDKCGFSLPEYLNEETGKIDGRPIANLAAFLALKEFIEKPIKISDAKHWVMVYDIKKFCVEGMPTDRDIKAKATVLVEVPAKYSEKNKRKIYIIESEIKYSIDRESAILTGHRRYNKIDVTGIIKIP